MPHFTKHLNILAMPTDACNMNCVYCFHKPHHASVDKMNIATVSLTDNYRPEFMPTYEPATIKIVYDADTRRILGGQIISKIDLTQFMNTLSVVIQNNMTIEELAMTDFFFQPHYNKPWSLLNAVALKAL